MNPQIIRLDVDHVGSQDPADQPTAADFAALSAYIKANRTRNQALLEAYRQASNEAERTAILEEAAGQPV